MNIRDLFKFDERMAALAAEIGADILALTQGQGDLSALNTADKSSLVASINELRGLLDAVDSSIIDDAANGTDSTWSASKILEQLNQVKSDIINGAPAAYDTLLEISNQLAADQTALSGVLDAVGNRVRYDAAQGLTAGQQQQACDNIGIGNPDTDFVAIYTAAKA